jgi:hypothetical protein
MKVSRVSEAIEATDQSYRGKKTFWKLGREQLQSRHIPMQRSSIFSVILLFQELDVNAIPHYSWPCGAQLWCCIPSQEIMLPEWQAC